MKSRTEEVMLVKGRLTQIGVSVRSGKARKRSAVFECSCGVKKVIDHNSITRGRTLSCGCFNREAVTQRSVNRTTHGHRRGLQRSRVYTTWANMLARCRNENNKEWKNYGCRGITVCDRWLSFENFLLDMGEPTTQQNTIERVNNNDNYEKSNCRWATRTEQSRNQRTNRLVTARGKTQCMAQWADETGISQVCIRRRLNRGWSDVDTVETPVKRKAR